MSSLVLSLREPDACSLWKFVIQQKNHRGFYENLKFLPRQHPEFTLSTRVFNLDETIVTTVQTLQEVVAGNETNQLNQATSAERGTLVTRCYIIAANGNYIFPVLVFPITNFKRHMVNKAPVTTLGLANKTG